MRGPRSTFDESRSLFRTLVKTNHSARGAAHRPVARSRHRYVHGFPSSADTTRGVASRREGVRERAIAPAVPRPRRAGLGGTPRVERQRAKVPPSVGCRPPRRDAGDGRDAFGSGTRASHSHAPRRCDRRARASARDERPSATSRGRRGACSHFFWIGVCAFVSGRPRSADADLPVRPSPQSWPKSRQPARPSWGRSTRSRTPRCTSSRRCVLGPDPETPRLACVAVEPNVGRQRIGFPRLTLPPLSPTQRKPMSEILDRTAYQRPGSFSEVRPPRVRARPERLSRPIFGSERGVERKHSPCRFFLFPETRDSPLTRRHSKNRPPDASRKT